MRDDTNFDLELGDRVVLNQKGKDLHTSPANERRASGGTLIRKGREGPSGVLTWIVKWDDLATPDSYFCGFLERPSANTTREG